MDRPALPSLSAFVASQYRGRWRSEARSDWAYVVFYRPFSAALALALARTSATPMAVTLAGGLSIPLMLAAAIFAPAALAGALVGLIGWLGGLLDCVDGDLARLTGRTSWLGRYVDFQIDVARWATLFVAAGLAADRAAGAGMGIFLGVAALAAWLRLSARAARDYRVATLGRDPPPAAAAAAEGAAPVAIGAWIGRFFVGLDGLLPIALGAGAALGVGGWALLLPLAMAIADAASTQWSNLRRYRREG
jgi:phosphatidylglycerophosphate synthase